MSQQELFPNELTGTRHTLPSPTRETRQILAPVFDSSRPTIAIDAAERAGNLARAKRAAGEPDGDRKGVDAAIWSGDGMLDIIRQHPGFNIIIESTFGSFRIDTLRNAMLDLAAETDVQIWTISPNATESARKDWKRDKSDLEDAATILNISEVRPQQLRPARKTVVKPATTYRDKAIRMRATGYNADCPYTQEFLMYAPDWKTARKLYPKVFTWSSGRKGYNAYALPLTAEILRCEGSHRKFKANFSERRVRGLVSSNFFHWRLPAVCRAMGLDKEILGERKIALTAMTFAHRWLFEAVTVKKKMAVIAL